MTSRCFASCAVGVASLLALAACRPPSVEEVIQRLPELPPDVAATLDATTLATRLPELEFGPPELLPPPAFAPCCSSQETRRLRVHYSYTKCTLPERFNVELSNLVLARSEPDEGPPGPKLYKLSELAGKRLARFAFCTTSQGPWDAVLTETRACSPYTPVYQLTLSALGDAVEFVWSGAQNPPADVQVVDCRTLGTVRTPCGSLGSCSCPSESCTVEASCQCNLELP